jgi:hypothetical protein
MEAGAASHCHHPLQGVYCARLSSGKTWSRQWQRAIIANSAVTAAHALE